MGAVVQHRDRIVVERVAGDGGSQAGGVVAVERLEGDLERIADAAQLRAQATQAMGVGGHLVAGGDHEQQRHVPQLGDEVREQQEGRLVRPVEIVEQHGDRPRRRQRGERAAQCLDQRRLARILR